MPDLIRSMARNNAWANEVLSAACAGLSGGAFNAARTGFFPSLRATLTHIYEVDLYYLDALEEGGQGAAVFGTTPAEIPAAGLGALQRQADLRLIRFCDGLAEGDLGRSVTTWRQDRPVPERLSDLLLHLLQHQVHHRGQAHAMLSGTDVAPPQLDDFHLVHGRTAAAQGWHDYHTKDTDHVS